VSGAIIASALLLYGGDVHGQGGDDRLRLRGVVPERSRVSVSRDEVFVPLDDRESQDGNAVRVGADGRVETVIAEIAVSVNSRTGYELRLEAESLKSAETPILQGEGMSLPYSLYFGDQKVEFAGGQAILVRNNAGGPDGSEIKPKPLRLRTEAPFDPPSDGVVLEDRLFLVFRAR